MEFTEAESNMLDLVAECASCLSLKKPRIRRPDASFLPQTSSVRLIGVVAHSLWALADCLPPTDQDATVEDEEYLEEGEQGEEEVPAEE